jgi:hypothetical protein
MVYINHFCADEFRDAIPLMLQARQNTCYRQNRVGIDQISTLQKLTLRCIAKSVSGKPFDKTQESLVET